MKQLFKVQAVNAKGFVLYRAYQEASSADESISSAKMYAGKVGKAKWSAEAVS